MIDVLDEGVRISTSGPRSAAIAERREATFEDFKRSNGFDEARHALAHSIFLDDVRERVTMVEVGEQAACPDIFSTHPTLEIPREIDSLALMRAARDDGYTSPLLQGYESARDRAGRD